MHLQQFLVQLCLLGYLYVGLRDRTQHATHPEMVQIWQENTLQSDEPSRKMIGNSNHSSGKTRLSKRTLVTLDTNNLQRSHKKKKSKKKVSKVSISFSSLDNTHEASNIFNNDHEENIAPSTSSRLTPLSASGATTSHVVTTVSTLHEELDEENKSSSPVDRLNQLRYTLRGGRTPVSSPPLVQQAHSTLQCVPRSNRAPNNDGGHDEYWNMENVPPPTTPCTGLLSRELDLDPDESVMLVSPVPDKAKLRGTTSKRRPLTATKLSGKPIRISRGTSPLSCNEEVEIGSTKNVPIVHERSCHQDTTTSKRKPLTATKLSGKPIRISREKLPLTRDEEVEIGSNKNVLIVHERSCHQDSTNVRVLSPPRSSWEDGKQEDKSKVAIVSQLEEEIQGKQLLFSPNSRKLDLQSSPEQSAFRRFEASKPALFVREGEFSKETNKPSCATDITRQQRTAIEQLERIGGNVAPLNQKQKQTMKRVATTATKHPEKICEKKTLQSLRTVMPYMPYSDSISAEFPISTSSSGSVCMDLSNMSRDANTSVRKQTPTNDQSREATLKEKNDTSKAMVFEDVEIKPPDWAEKQCSAFNEWLNYTLEPSEARDEESETSEKTAFRALVQHQRMAAVRVKSSKLLQSTEMNKIRDKIRSEIGRGRLVLREDRDLYANIGVRDQIISLLFSYSTPWLRLGLETIFGEVILCPVSQKTSPKKLSDGTGIHRYSPKKRLNQIQHALRDFIVNRVLSDKTVLSKYTRRLCKVPSGKFGTKYQSEIRSLVLYRLLVLFFFLDRAKGENLLDKVPRLFTCDAEVKSSKDLLLYFCRHYLSQEGDFIKHLSRMHLHVSYRQEPVDEIDFSVTNLAVDLRDGVRLTRLVEILTHAPAKSLLIGLRLPAVSRLQKLHNVGLVLQTLRENGVLIGQDVMPHQVVDSHREIVLGLLWAVISRFCIKRLVDENKVKNEITRIRRSRGEHHNPSESWEQVEEGDNRIRMLLLEWCATVCSEFGVRVSNLTTDFTDGVVVCVILHYYLPNLVRLSEIRRTSRSTSFMNRSKGSEEIVRRNERMNCEFANRKLYKLGGVGRMVPTADSSNIPDPKAMLLCLVFMYSRVIDCSSEIRASLTLQRFIRERQRLVLVKNKMEAARLIMLKWTENKENYFEAQRRRYGPAVKTIELFFQNRKHRLEEMRKRRLMWEHIKRKTVLIQSLVRAMIARNKFRAVVRQHMVCTTLQCWWRHARASRVLLTLRVNRDAARKIQRAYRWSKEVDRSKNLAAIVVQSRWRSFSSQVQYQIDIMDIIDVQRCARRYLALRYFNWKQTAVVKLQVAVRGLQARRYLDQLKDHYLKTSCATVLQAAFRGFLEVKNYELARQSVKTVQTAWRCSSARRNFSAFSKAVVTLQSRCRSRLAVSRYQALRGAAVKIQASFRGMWSRLDYSHAIELVLSCQAVVRSWLAKKISKERRNAIITIQSYERTRQAQDNLVVVKVATAVIQSHWRAACARSNFQVVLHKVILFQKVVRGFLRFKRFQDCKSSSMTLQRWFRVRLSIQKLETLRSQRAQLEDSSATLLQSCYRGYLFRRELLILQSYARIIQTAYRGFIARVALRSDIVCICAVQSTCRVWLSKKKAHRKHKAALKVQACGRMILAAKSANTRRASIRAALCIQCAYRKLRARLMYMYLLQKRIEMERLSRAARSIQLSVRKFLSRYHAATKLQKTWRCYSVHIDFMLVILSSITIQSTIRRVLAICLSRRKANAVAVLQRFGRKAVEKVQATKLIQRCTRGYFVRLQLEVQDYAATEIQRLWRGYVWNMFYLNAVVSAVMIQAVMRSWLATRHVNALRMKRLADLFARERSSAIIQSVFRGYMVQRRLELAALLVQRKWRNKQSRREFLFQRKQIISLQARLRSWLLRRMRTKKVAAAATRVLRANKKAQMDPSQTLGARTRWALGVLLKSTRLEKIMNAVRSLEVATQHSKECCRDLTDANAAATLFTFVRSCNRSLPHLELIHCILRTLANVSSHAEFLPSIATTTGGEVLLDLVQMFRDKDLLFHLAVMLLEKIVLQNQEVKDLGALHENIKRLKTVVALSKRKANISTPAARYRGKTEKGYNLEFSDSILGVRALQRIIRVVNIEEY